MIENFKEQLKKNEKGLSRVLFVYFISLNIFTITGAYVSLGNFIPLWNIFCFAFLSFYVIYSTRLKKFSSKYVLLFSLFLLSCLATGWVAIEQGSGVSSVFAPSQVLPPAFLFLFLVLAGRQFITPKAVITFNALIVAFVVFACIYNVIANYAYINLSVLSSLDPHGLLLSSFYTNRNTFGFILFIGIVAAMVNMHVVAKGRLRFVYLMSLALFIVSLIFTMSRGAILVTTVFMIVYVLLVGKLRALMKLAFVLILIVVGVYLTLGQDFVNNNIIRADAGATGRDVLQEFGLDYFQNHNIIFGSGAVQPTDELEEKYGFKSFHSTYVTILAEGGLLLMTSYALLFIIILLSMIKVYKSNKILGSMFIAMLIAYLAYGFLETNVLLRFESNSIIATIYLIILPVYLMNYYALSMHKNKHVRNAISDKVKA